MSDMTAEERARNLVAHQNTQSFWQAREMIAAEAIRQAEAAARIEAREAYAREHAGWRVAARKKALEEAAQIADDLWDLKPEQIAEAIRALAESEKP